VNSHNLEKELAEVKDTLQKESDEHDTLRITVGVVCNDLELALAQETSSLMVHATQIIEWACKIMRHTLRFGVQQSSRSPVLITKTSIWRR
jgi:hypothetical protein